MFSGLHVIEAPVHVIEAPVHIRLYFVEAVVYVGYAILHSIQPCVDASDPVQYMLQCATFVDSRQIGEKANSFYCGPKCRRHDLCMYSRWIPKLRRCMDNKDILISIWTCSPCDLPIDSSLGVDVASFPPFSLTSNDNLSHTQVFRICDVT